MSADGRLPVGVVGAGIMGAGIAQVAAQAGHPVLLHDARAGAAAAARSQLAATLEQLAAKGRMTGEEAAAAAARIEPVADLRALAPAGVVVEAIVERLDAKRALLRELESVVTAQTLLATNTSSISITALAHGLQHPQRLVGMHFFNPVPLMKLVEVVSGLHTDTAAAQAVFDLARRWGKTPVHAKSTPGFIVNRIARPYYAEALALLQEQAAEPAVIDACLRGAGFRMGPCELMDLIGHDTNFAVTQSVYEANFFDKRYVPSLVQREMVDGGLLGRKSGRGFYRYPEGPTPPVDTPLAAPAHPTAVTVHGQGPVAAALAAALGRGVAGDGDGAAAAPVRHAGAAAGWTGIEVDGARLVLTDGRTAAELAAAFGDERVAVFDRFDPGLAPSAGAASRPALAYAVFDGTGDPGARQDRGAADDRGWAAQAPRWLQALGFQPLPVLDTPGLVVARTLAMIVNEAADTLAQGVCSADAADQAMKLGVNYPRGPFEWLAAWAPTPRVAAADVSALLDALDSHCRGERYRVSPWLRRRAQGAAR